MNTKLWKILYILVLLALSAALLFYSAGQKSFWEDETFTATYAQKEPADLLEGIAWDVHPPLYLYLVGQWGRLIGFDEIGLRSFSIVWALAALLLTFKLAYDLLGEKTAFVAFTLLAVNPLFIMFGHNARYYSLAVLLTLLVAWSALRFKLPKQALFLVLYVVSGAIFLYLLFAGAAVLLAANLWWLARWFLQKDRRSVWSLVIWLLAQAIVVGLYLPGLSAAQSVAGRFGELAEVGNWLVELAKRAGYYAFISAVGETISPLNPLAWAGALLAVGLVIYALVKYWRQFNFWLLIVFFLAPAVINLALTFNIAVSATWQNLPYRTLYIYPFLMIWLAAGLVMLPRRWGIASGAVLLLVFLAGIFNYSTNRQFLRPVYTVPWPRIFDQIRAESQPGALVICGYGDYSCYYYAENNGFPRNDLGRWPNLSKKTYPEIWYIQTNLSRDEAYGDAPGQQADFLTEMAGRYFLEDIYPFAPQDAGISSLKSKLMDQEAFDYRVLLHRFYQP